MFHTIINKIDSNIYIELGLDFASSVIFIVAKMCEILLANKEDVRIVSVVFNPE